MARNIHLALVCAALVAFSSFCLAREPAPTAAAGELQLLASINSADTAIDGCRPAELSALAFDRDDRELCAAFDRGVLFRLALQRQSGLLRGAAVEADWPMRHPVDGSSLDGKALAGCPAWPESDGKLIVAPAFGARAFRPDTLTRAVATLSWPRGVVPTPEGSAASRHGVEALDWHPVHGLIGVMGRAKAGMPMQQQAHARGGSHCCWPALAEGADIKACEVVSPQPLLLLEHVRDLGRGGSRFYLRSIDLSQSAAAASQLCEPTTWRVPLPDQGDNLEGLACLREFECLLVGDSGEASRRSQHAASCAGAVRS